MTARILDGKVIAQQIKNEIRDKLIRNWALEFPILPDYKPPCLAVVLCTNDPASELYVERKRQACGEVGINSFLIRPFEGGINKWSKPQKHLISTIEYLNKDSSVNGILVQLPLPEDIDNYEVFDAIDPLKDVDVFNPINVGLLLQGRPRFIPCTPQGIQELLSRYNIQIAGKKVCIINRSDVVGKPLHALLIQNNAQANATVTMCHDNTSPNLLKLVCLSSDIIVVAVGIPNFLTADLVPVGAVVVDVGITRIPGSSKIVGDVDFGPVSEKASWVSPVPGGVGPMTIAMLLKNVMAATSFNNRVL